MSGIVEINAIGLYESVKNHMDRSIERRMEKQKEQERREIKQNIAAAQTLLSKLYSKRDVDGLNIDERVFCEKLERYVESNQ